MVSKKDKDLAQKKKLREEQTGFAGGTITDAARVHAKGDLGQTSLEKQKSYCEVIGGKWDAVNNRCIRPPELEAQALKERQEATRESLKPTVTPEQTPEQPVEQQVEQPVQDQSFFQNVQSAIEGRPIEIGGKEFNTGMRGTVAEEEAGTAPKFNTVNPLIYFTPQGQLGKTAAFLSNVDEAAATVVSKGAAPGSRALGTNPRALGTNPRAVAQVGKVNEKSALLAPSKIKALLNKMSGTTKLILGGSIAKISNDLLTDNIKSLEQETTKVGEQLTKLAEAATYGFSLDEDGNLFEYTTAIALARIEEVEQELLDAEQALQQASIGKSILQITGRSSRLRLAQDEIDKQKDEIIVARGKVIINDAVPPERLLAAREYLRGFDLE